MAPKAKVAEGRLVDDVHRHAVRAGGGGKARAFRIILDGADGDRRAIEIVRCPFAMMDGELPAGRAIRERGDLRHHLAGIKIQRGAGGEQQLGLPRRGRGTAGEHDAASFQREEQRQARQRRHALAVMLTRPPVLRHVRIP